MVRGICVKCKKTVGSGFFDSSGYICTSCKKVYCRDCPPKSAPGFLSGGALCCPDCGRQLKNYRY